MAFDKIKKDDTVLIKGVVASKTEDFLYVNFLGRRNERVLEYFHRECVEHLECEPTPKHDPCRKFRKGDIVEPCAVNGRWCSHVWEDRSSRHYEVAEAEDPLTAQMEVKDPDSPYTFLVHAAFFKLITPMEGYFRVDGDEDEQEFYVKKGAFFVASYGYGPDDFYKKEEAKAAAQAECDRLNELYRKEME